MSIAEDVLVEFVDRTMDHPLPDAVREKVGLAVLDAAALAVDARRHPVVEAVGTLSRPQEPRTAGTARRWTDDTWIPALDACFANAVAAHAHFHDDTDMVAWGHPGSLITAAPFALAQGENISAETALRGMAVGYATLTWLGAEEEASRAIVERGFRAGPTLGVIAVAAAAAGTLQLPPDQIRSAIGIAADSAGALLEPVRAGAQDWRLQAATACMRGAQAALLARAGVVGPPEPITGATGLYVAFTGKKDLPARWSQPPAVDDIHRTWFKAMPTLGDNMAVAVAARQIYRDVLAERADARIGAVTVGMNAHFAGYPGTAYKGPFDTVDQAVASTSFAAAALLLHGAIRFHDYPALMGDQRVLDLAERIRIEPSRELDYVSGWVRAEVDGETITRAAADAPATEFFRDRPVAAAAAAEVTGPKAVDAAHGWYAWLDEPTTSSSPLDDLLDGLHAAV